MKIFQFFAGNLLFVFTFTAILTGQTKSPPNFVPVKVGTINVDALYDSNTGIKELAEAHRKLENELKPQSEKLNIMAQEIHNFAKSVREMSLLCKASCSEQVIKANFADYDLSVDKYRIEQDKMKLNYEKRKSELLENFMKKIAEKVEIFTKEKGYTTIFDAAKLPECDVFMGCNDVTLDFIQFCKSYILK